MNTNEFPALLLIDIQKGLDELDFYGGRRSNPEAEENAARLLRHWRDNDFLVFHVKHNSDNPNSPLAKGKPGNEIKDLVQPKSEEPLLEKDVNSAFIGTDLENQLKRQGIYTLVVAGLTIEHCISTSVRMAANLGFKIFLPSDATAAFDKIGYDGQKYSAEVIHGAELASLNGEFATVISTEKIINKFNR